MLANRLSDRLLDDPARPSDPGWVLPVVMLLAAGVRAAYLLGDHANLVADEAVTGITVHAMLHGEGFVFYPGQSYGGTLEIYLQALIYLLPVPRNELTLRLALLVLAAVSTGLVLLVGRRLLPRPELAVAAAAFYAVGPWFNILGSITALGFYSAGVTLGLGALYCALRAPDGPAGWAFGLGLCTGLALWTSLTSLYLVLPAVLWAAPILGRRVLGALLGLILGLVPALGWALVHQRLPLPPPGQADPDLSTRVDNLVDPVLREFLGVAYAHGTGGPPRLVQDALVALLAAAYGIAVWRRRRRLLALVTLRRRGRDPLDLLLVAPVVVAVGYVSSPLAWYVGTPRYLFTAYPWLALSLAALIPVRPGTGPLEHRRWPGHVGSRFWPGHVGSRFWPVPVGLSALLCASILAGGASPGVDDRDAVLRRVAAFLHSRQETSVYAAYPTAMTLQYVAGDALDVANCEGVPRFPRTQSRVAAASDPVYVDSPLAGSGLLTAPPDTIGNALSRHGVQYRTTQIGFVRIYDRLEPVPGTPAAVCR